MVVMNNRRKIARMKAPSEAETRANILQQAREIGMEEQVLKIFARFDDALKNAKDDYQRHHIAACGAAELHKLFGCQGPLVIDDVEILPGAPGWEKDAQETKRIIKLD
jgi:hypothetical protein